MVLLGFILLPDAYAVTVNISDVPSCLVAGGVHQIATNEGHFAGSLTIPQADTWNVSNLRLGIATLILEGEVNALAEMDVDFLTNRGTINVAGEQISIGPNNSWLNDCDATINLLPNTSFRFDGSGTNHGTINGDSTNDFNPGNLASNTIFNSGTISPSIVLTNIVIANVESPCDPPPPEPQPSHSHELEFGDEVEGDLGCSGTPCGVDNIAKCPDGTVMTGIEMINQAGNILYTPICRELTVLDFIGVLFAIGGELLQINTISILLAYAIVNTVIAALASWRLANESTIIENSTRIILFNFSLYQIDSNTNANSNWSHPYSIYNCISKKNRYRINL